MATVVQSKSAILATGEADTLDVVLASTPIEGNVLVALHVGGEAHTGGSHTISGSGWTEQLDALGSDPPWLCHALYFKVAGASEPTTITIDGSTGDAYDCIGWSVLEISGLDTADLLETGPAAAEETAASTSIETSDAVVAAGAFLVAAVGIWEDSTADQNFTHSTDWTELPLSDLAATGASGANEFNFVVAYRQVASSGTYTNVFSWQDNSTYGERAMIIAFNLGTRETTGAISGGGGVTASVTPFLKRSTRAFPDLAEGLKGPVVGGGGGVTVSAETVVPGETYGTVSGGGDIVATFTGAHSAITSTEDSAYPGPSIRGGGGITVSFLPSVPGEAKGAITGGGAVTATVTTSRLVAATISGGGNVTAAVTNWLELDRTVGVGTSAVEPNVGNAETSDIVGYTDDGAPPGETGDLQSL